MKITMQKTNELTLEEGYHKFIQKCRVKNLSEKTIEYYDKEFRRFLKFIDGNMPLDEITAVVIEDYTLFLKKESDANDVTIATYMRAIRAIFYYVMKIGYMKTYAITIRL